MKQKKYNDNVMTPEQYDKMKRNKQIDITRRRKRKGKKFDAHEKRIEE